MGAFSGRSYDINLYLGRLCGYDLGFQDQGLPVGHPPASPLLHHNLRCLAPYWSPCRPTTSDLPPHIRPPFHQPVQIPTPSHRPRHRQPPFAHPPLPEFARKHVYENCVKTARKLARKLRENWVKNSDPPMARKTCTPILVLK